MSYPFDLKSVYNFDVYPVTLLGSNWQNVTVMSLMDYATVMNSGFDAPAMHAQVFSYLPSGTPNDPSQYDYVKLKTAAGAITYLGIAWINLASVVQVDSVTIVVTIGNVTSASTSLVRQALVQNGFNNLSMTVNGTSVVS